MKSLPFEIFADTAGLEALAGRLGEVGNQAPHVLRRAINWTGDKARTRVTRALVRQTGAKYRTVRAALRTRRASYGDLTYRIIAFGGHLSLKEFAPRQRRDGVSAKPWGRRLVFRHAFISAALGGHVFIRELAHSAEGTGRVEGETADARRVARLPIRQLWGPALPREIVKDETQAAFFAVVSAELVARAEHELSALVAGHTPRG